MKTKNNTCSASWKISALTSAGLVIISSFPVSTNYLANFQNCPTRLFSIKCEDSNQFVLNVEPDEYNCITNVFFGDAIMDKNMICNIEKLDKFASFRKNWNGYGAAPFSSELICNTKSLIYKLHYQPEIFPIAGDGIQFEYDKADGSHLEMELSLDKEVSVYISYANGDEHEFTVPRSDENISRVVDEFNG